MASGVFLHRTGILEQASSIGGGAGGGGGGCSNVDVRTWATASYSQRNDFVSFKGNIINVSGNRCVSEVDLLNGTIGQDVSLYINTVSDPGATPASPALLGATPLLDINVEKRTISNGTSETFTLSTPVILSPGLYVVAFILDGPTTVDVGIGGTLSGPPVSDGVISHYWGAQAVNNDPSSGGSQNVRWSEDGIHSMRITHSQN